MPKRKLIPPTEAEDRAITHAAETDPNNPPLEDEALTRMRPATEIHPAVVEAHRRGGIRHRGPQKAPTKERITIRLSPDVVEHFRATGKGWQSRVDEALREYIREHD
ncbi:BrnA antitoxin family protein [Endothiovibrio diazotrophicus]